MEFAASHRPQVLIPHRLGANIYVQQLGRAYQELGCSVVFGTENFVESNLEFDIIHLNWPEEIYRTVATGSLENQTSIFLRVLKRWQEQGAFIAWTVHNLEPHEMANPDLEMTTYQQVIDNAQLIHHHCERSKSLLGEKYSVDGRIKQISVPHGNFLAYENKITREQARKHLGISSRRFVFLHIGAIRGYKNFDFVRDGFLKTPIDDKLLLVAGRQDTRPTLKERIRSYIDRKFRSEFLYELRQIENNELQYFLNACDVVVLGHSRGLNSGIAVLAMSFGKPVIGPSIGCVTDVLRSGKNLLYEPGQFDSFVKAMADSGHLSREHVSESNQAAAKSWSWTALAEAVLEAAGKK